MDGKHVVSQDRQLERPLPLPQHHVQQQFCYTRPPYRDPNKPRAVKVTLITYITFYRTYGFLLRLSSDLSLITHLE